MDGDWMTHDDRRARRNRLLMVAVYVTLLASIVVLVVVVARRVDKGVAYGPEILAGLDSVRVAAVQSREAASAARDVGARVDSAAARLEAAMRVRSDMNRRFIARWNRVLEQRVHETHDAVDSLKHALPPPKRR